MVTENSKKIKMFNLRWKHCRSGRGLDSFDNLGLSLRSGTRWMGDISNGVPKRYTVDGNSNFILQLWNQYCKSLNTINEIPKSKNHVWTLVKSRLWNICNFFLRINFILFKSTLNYNSLFIILFILFYSVLYNSNFQTFGL